MLSRLRNVSCGLLILLASGCVTPMEGEPHPDLDVELLLQLLNDIDTFVMNYAWLLALLGL